MLDLIDRAGAIGWGTVLVVIALVILLVPIAIEGWNRFLKSLGLIQKKTLQEKQREKEMSGSRRNTTPSRLRYGTA